jgi:hypothetical protein
MNFRFAYAALATTLALNNEKVASFSTAPSLDRLRKTSAGAAFIATKQNGYVVPFVGGASTEMSMGKVEEFLTGRDDKAREKANEKYLAGLQKRVDKINELEADVEDLGDDELMAKTEKFKERLKSGEDINGPILEEAFTVVREAAWYVKHHFY